MYLKVRVKRFINNGRDPYVNVMYRAKGCRFLQQLCNGYYDYGTGTFYASSFNRTRRNVEMLRAALMEYDWHENVMYSHSRPKWSDRKKKEFAEPLQYEYLWQQRTT